MEGPTILLQLPLLLPAVTVTGVRTVLVRLPSAREGNWAINGATLVKTNASQIVAVAGAPPRISHLHPLIARPGGKRHR